MGCKVVLGEICSFSRGASVPRARMLDQGDFLYIHYGDLYKGFDVRIDVDNPQKPIPYIAGSEPIRESQLLCDQDIVYVLTSETVEDLGHAFLFNNPKELPAVAGTETTIVRVNRPDLVLPSYLNWLFQSARFKKLLRQYVKGMKVFRVHPDDLAQIEIEIPSIDDQRRIVSILDATFERSLINNRINGYLADLGDALFAQALKENKQEIAYQTVESFCEVKGGKRLPKGSELISDVNSHPYIRVRDLNNTTVLQLTPEMLYVDDETQANISRYIVNDGDVIVSVVGTIGLTAYIGNTLNGANLTENCNKLTSFNGDLAAWSYFFLRSPDGAEAIRLGTVGAVQAKLPLKNIKSIEVPFVPALEMEKTVAKLNDILSAIQTNLVESLALGELRTTLLPRLISGEIDVSKIDITQLNSHLV